MVIDETMGRTLNIGTDLINFLRINLDVFTFLAADMARVDLEIIVHNLNVGEDQRPVK